MSLPPPKGYDGFTPYLTVSPAAEALAFYAKAFGASELFRIEGPNDTIMHAEMDIMGGRIMLSDAFAEVQEADPIALGGTPVLLMLYVDDADAVVSRAVTAGCKIVQPVQDQFYGDRSGTVSCPYGHRWTFATHMVDVGPEELNRIVKERFGD